MDISTTQYTLDADLMISVFTDICTRY